MHLRAAGPTLHRLSPSMKPMISRGSAHSSLSRKKHSKVWPCGYTAEAPAVQSASPRARLIPGRSWVYVRRVSFCYLRFVVAFASTTGLPWPTCQTLTARSEETVGWILAHNNVSPNAVRGFALSGCPGIGRSGLCAPAGGSRNWASIIVQGGCECAPRSIFGSRLQEPPSVSTTRATSSPRHNRSATFLRW